MTDRISIAGANQGFRKDQMLSWSLRRLSPTLGRYLSLWTMHCPHDKVLLSTKGACAHARCLCAESPPPSVWGFLHFKSSNDNDKEVEIFSLAHVRRQLLHKERGKENEKWDKWRAGRVKLIYQWKRTPSINSVQTTSNWMAGYSRPQISLK